MGGVPSAAYAFYTYVFREPGLGNRFIRDALDQVSLLLQRRHSSNPT